MHHTRLHMLTAEHVIVSLSFALRLSDARCLRHVHASFSFKKRLSSPHIHSTPPPLPLLPLSLSSPCLQTSVSHFPPSYCRHPAYDACAIFLLPALPAPSPTPPHLCGLFQAVMLLMLVQNEPAQQHQCVLHHAHVPYSTQGGSDGEAAKRGRAGPGMRRGSEVRTAAQDLDVAPDLAAEQKNVPCMQDSSPPSKMPDSSVPGRLATQVGTTAVCRTQFTGEESSCCHMQMHTQCSAHRTPPQFSNAITGRSAGYIFFVLGG